MLIKKIKYTDYNGVEREEEFYFNLSKAEVLKWLTTNGAYTIDSVLKKMIDTENVKDMIGEFEYLIQTSYGEKSLDGKTFDKSPEILRKFVNSEAYSVLFMELAGDAKKAAEFFNGIVPSDLAAEVDKIMKENPEALTDVNKAKEMLDQKPTLSNVTQMPTNN